MYCIKHRDEDGNWYLAPNGAWVPTRRFARFFETEAYAHKLASIKENEMVEAFKNVYHPRLKVQAVSISKNWRT